VQNYENGKHENQMKGCASTRYTFTASNKASSGTEMSQDSGCRPKTIVTLVWISQHDRAISAE